MGLKVGFVSIRDQDGPVFRHWLNICQLFVKTILRSGFSTDNEFRLEASVEPGNIDDRAVTGKKDGLRVDPPLVNGDDP